MRKANMNFGNNREPIMRARQAAEALFGPKPEAERQPLSDPKHPVAARKPRVLPALSLTPIRQETVDATAAPRHLAAPVEIPAQRSARIRTLVKYGMTVAQVAEAYGMPVETIARMLRKV
jgi:hypothetical protein